METADHLTRQLASLRDLRTIVRTMKALAASSIRQYEQAVAALAVYYRTVEFGLQVVLKDTEPATVMSPSSPARRRAFIIFGSDHGLCGRFNEEIVDHALEAIGTDGVTAQRPLLITVGARPEAALSHAGRTADSALPAPGSAEQITATVQKILMRIDAWHSETGDGEVRMFYNRHSGAKGYTPASATLLPVEIHQFQRLQEKHWPGRTLPMFTMDAAALFTRLLRQYLFVSIFRACAESQASEHASRLAAMQAAERNLDERLDEVGAHYRRARQDAITSELLDVVSGFEAITSSGNGTRE